MWKDKLIEFVKDCKHPAWGFTHFTRVYELSLELATAQKADVDDDALYAAAYLHDIGAFEPFRQEGRDHSDVAIENCDEILNSIDDTLEFMGIIGITRILSIVGIADWTPDLKSAINLIENFSKDLSQSLYTEPAKEMGKSRQKEMIEYLDNLGNETNKLNLI